MKEIKCPRCNRTLKFTECLCKERGRKRIMLHFSCCHCSYLVYNVPCSMDNNTILKDFRSIIKDGCENIWCISTRGDRYLNFDTKG